MWPGVHAQQLAVRRYDLSAKQVVDG